MKRSELKEAIKAEIKSVLSEEIQVGDIVTLGGDGDELKVIDKRRMFGSDMMAYRVKFPDGNTEEYSADQLRPARMMNEGKKGVVVDPDEIKFHLDQFYGGNIDGNDLANAIEEILSDMMKRSVSFSDIREKEMTDAEKKKAAEKDAKKEKDFANKQKAVDKLKKELADNKDELVKIAKISRNERTKAQQNLLDDMAKKTKELKKLKRVEI
jgi:hypothetical protein